MDLMKTPAAYETTLYRLMFISPKGEIIGRPTVMKCEADSEAVELAELFAKGRSAQVWQDERLVLHHDPQLANVA